MLLTYSDVLDPSIMDQAMAILSDTNCAKLEESQGSRAARGEGETELPLRPDERAQTPAGAQGEVGMCSRGCFFGGGCSQPAAEHVGWLELLPEALAAPFQRAFQAGSATFQTQMCSHCSSALPGQGENTGTSQFQQQDDDMRWCADHSIAALPLWMNRYKTIVQHEEEQPLELVVPELWHPDTLDLSRAEHCWTGEAEPVWKHTWPTG
ncbi:hypothetical protein DV515_00010022 [Chloebia gouldiae]|uniref:Uncharacterized protein n=1 Tax=Chloebia gouldiae TaxID=44316 RepID=A0A3L8SAY1_CHLGU|nr:hypothetical protein DV515_00010022 [Chloebia gouldiae]